MLGIVGILCGLIACLLYYYLTESYNFWKKLNVPGPSPTLFFGTMKDVILCKTLYVEYLKKLYYAYENTAFVGFFKMKEPILMIRDPEHIKDVFIKNEIFSERGTLLDMHIVWLKASFFFFGNGKVAQFIRPKISPLLTPHKLKHLFCMMLKSTERLDNYLEEYLQKNNYEIDCVDMTLRLLTDMVGHTLIGIDMKTLTEGTTEENKFWAYTKRMQGRFWSLLLRFAMIWDKFPQLYNWFDYHLTNYEKSRRSYIDFISKIMKYRKEHNIVKSDLINVMMELKENSKYFTELCGVDITDEFIAAQVYFIFHAAYERSQLVICNTLYELALNQNIQDKLRKEICDTYARDNDEIQYGNINSMPYLDAVCKETMRKYTQSNTIQRVASSSYTFKNTNITVPKGQKIIIPIHALHFDPKIYLQPEIYDPERFIDKTAQSKFSGYFLPFGHGQRNCIGERLAKLQVKIALTGIVHNYKLDICKRTVLFSELYSVRREISTVKDTEFLLMKCAYYLSTIIASAR